MTNMIEHFRMGSFTADDVISFTVSNYDAGFSSSHKSIQALILLLSKYNFKSTLFPLADVDDGERDSNWMNR